MLRPTSDDFPKLALRTSDGPVQVKESERVVGETVTTRTEPYLDADGQLRIRTVEYVEKIIEREVLTAAVWLIKFFFRLRAPCMALRATVKCLKEKMWEVFFFFTSPSHYEDSCLFILLCWIS